MVTELVRQRRRGRLGYRGYVLPILRTLVRYRPPRFAVRLDGGAPIECAFAIASNLPCYGGVLRVTPDARCDSGRLEVALFERATAADLVRFAGPAWRGTLAAQRGVRCGSATRIEVDGSQAPVAVQVDGDAWGATPIRIELAPRAVPILAPAQPAAGGSAGGSRSAALSG